MMDTLSLQSAGRSNGRRPVLPPEPVPAWPDPAAVAEVTAILATLPPIVAAQEADTLRQRLAEVAFGRAFLLQGGGTETFRDNSEAHLAALTRTVLQMAVVLTYGASLPIVKVGRVAGQYAIPISYDRGANGLPAYQGDMINGPKPTLQSRTPDPRRMLGAYANATAVMNLLRSYAGGGLASLRAVHEWTNDFVRDTAPGERYERLAAEIDRALRFMRACGVSDEALRATELYCSHEAVVLDYERALARVHPHGSGVRAYDLSAHMLWVGEEQTRRLDGAHITFLSRVANPIGVQLGPTNAEDAADIVKRLDPGGIPGRLTLITTMGSRQVRRMLPPIIEKVTAIGRAVVWACNPMHANTYTSAGGYPTLHFDQVVDEVQGFFDVHQLLGTHPGGIHLELSGDNVTECLGGPQPITESDLPTRYETAHEPRLNSQQSLELAFLIAERLQEGKGHGALGRHESTVSPATTVN